VVEQDVDPKRLEGLSSEKLDIAIRPGVEHLEEMLEDVRTMTPAQLKAKYGDELPPAPMCPTCNRALPRRAQQARHFPQLFDVEWLHTRYVERGMSQQNIAAELGCSQRSVSAALRRHGIPTREPRFGYRQAG
jgi:hypothetical protein